jgi:hypothetical protein
VANTEAPCSLATFLFNNFPSYRELSCAADSGMCALDFIAMDYDGGTLLCGERRFVRLDTTGPESPCVAPVLGRGDRPSEEWVLLLDNVGFRRPDGGFDSHDLMLRVVKGKVQVSSSDLPGLPVTSVADDDYLRSILSVGLRECRPGIEVPGYPKPKRTYAGPGHKDTSNRSPPGGPHGNH